MQTFIYEIVCIKLIVNKCIQKGKDSDWEYITNKRDQ